MTPLQIHDHVSRPERWSTGTPGFRSLARNLVLNPFRDRSWHRIQGGNQLLPERMAQLLGRVVRFGYAVRCIEQSSSGVTLFFEQDNEKRCLSFDRCIVTAPLATHEAIEFEPPLSARRLGLSSNVTTQPAVRVCVRFTDRAAFKAERLNGFGATRSGYEIFQPS
jgi:monoamine oxidase